MVLGEVHYMLTLGSLLPRARRACTSHLTKLNVLKEKSEKREMQKDIAFFSLFLLKTWHPLGLKVHLGVFIPEFFLTGVKMG